MTNMIKFSYKMVVFPTNRQMTEQSLNELGEEGWELVSVDFDLRTYILKKMYLVEPEGNEDN